MRQVIIFAVWLVLVAGIFGAIFAPNYGLIHGGSMASLGPLLLGVALCVHHRTGSAANRDATSTPPQS